MVFKDIIASNSGTVRKPHAAQKCSDEGLALARQLLYPHMMANYLYKLSWYNQIVVFHSPTDEIPQYL